METNWNRYTCDWHTRIGPGSTYYEGRETLWGEDEEDAMRRCQQNVQRRAFRDYSPNHIVITRVTQAN